MFLKQYFQLLIDALRLSRANNLVIVFITQYFAAICLLDGQFTILEIVKDYRFFAMVLSTIIIAASGYYINDYYDIKIDLINKPDKVIVGKQISRRQVMLAHMSFNGLGIFLGLWVSVWIGAVNFLAAFLLWLYSNYLKRLPFVGNLLVAILTGATILMLSVYFQINSLLLLTYAFFAFGINLIRELIKDIEDIKGDASFGSSSLPVILGIRRTKQVLYLLILLFSISLIWFLFNLGNNYLSVYFSILFIPYLHFTYVLIKADTKKQFGFLSKYCKWLILAGILSMVLLKF